MRTYSRVLVVFSFIITHMFGNSLLLLVMPSDFLYDVSGLHDAAFEVLTYVLQASYVHPWIIESFQKLQQYPGMCISSWHSLLILIPLRDA